MTVNARLLFAYSILGLISGKVGLIIGVTQQLKTGCVKPKPSTYRQKSGMFWNGQLNVLWSNVTRTMIVIRHSV